MAPGNGSGNRNIHLVHIRFPDLYIQCRLSFLNSKFLHHFLFIVHPGPPHAPQSYLRCRCRYRSHFSMCQRYRSETVPPVMYRHVFLITRGKIIMFIPTILKADENFPISHQPIYDIKFLINTYLYYVGYVTFGNFFPT